MVRARLSKHQRGQAREVSTFQSHACAPPTETIVEQSEACRFRGVFFELLFYTGSNLEPLFKKRLYHGRR